MVTWAWGCYRRLWYDYLGLPGVGGSTGDRMRCSYQEFWMLYNHMVQHVLLQLTSDRETKCIEYVIMQKPV